MSKLKIAGVVILYEPSDEDLSNMNTYIDDVDLLYVIDNSIEKNDSRLIKSKKIKYIFNNENKGLSIPYNDACELARKDGYKWLLTMDQDTRFEKNVLNVLKDKIEHTDTSDIGIVVAWHNTKLHVPKPKEDIDYPLDVMSSGNLVNLDIHKKLGGFKDWLFIDGIDIEYGLNLRKHGFKIMRVNTVEMIHNLGDLYYKKVLNKEILVTNHSALRRYYMVRNYLYIRDMYIDIEPEFCKILVKFKTLVFAIVFYENNKLQKLKAMRRGYKDYKHNVRGKRV